MAPEMPARVALSLTARGWHVLPLCWPVDGACGCGRGHVGRDTGKAPLLPAGWQDARADAGQVRTWWRRWPRANVGLLIEPAGLLVVDLDGRAAVAEADGLGCPRTYTVRRGDHMHLYFRRPEGVPATRRVHRGACRAIDVLAAGYVVAAGSLHVSGDRYEAVQEGPLAQAPAWAADMLRPPVAAPTHFLAPATVPERLSRHAEAVLRDGPAADPARYPSRSEAVQSVVWSMLRAGYSDEDIVGTLLRQGWIAQMRGRIEWWLRGEVARARAAGAGPDTLEPMPAAAAVAAFRTLPEGLRTTLASAEPKRRMAGAVEAARRGVPVEALCAFEAVANGGDLQEARSVARWATRTAQAPHAAQH